jgi:CDP-paratose 2-epimerase
MKILITGGAGFVGSNLAKLFKESEKTTEVVVFDNLKRRGSEINLPEFKKRGIRFVHGDIRQSSDLEDITDTFDLLIEASAEPSVLAGLNSRPNYLLQTNLEGTLNCAEYARKKAGALLFLSTSRVYSIAPLRELKLQETSSRFELAKEQVHPGVSSLGISEEFPVHLPRSLYGATKLASEMILQEYAFTYKYPILINRCGVIAGPGQFGKVDQGVFTLWAMHHVMNKSLKYTGFGGAGKQVRDLIHPKDLFHLIQKQIKNLSMWNAESYNVGGGREISVSMKELTELCHKASGKRVEIHSQPESAMVDIPLYLTDHSKATRAFDWNPKITAEQIITEITLWVISNQKELEQLLF